VSHPGLESANVHSMPQMLGGKRVPEFVQEVVLAVWTFRALAEVVVIEAKDPRGERSAC